MRLIFNYLSGEHVDASDIAADNVYDIASDDHEFVVKDLMASFGREGDTTYGGTFQSDRYPEGVEPCHVWWMDDTEQVAAA